MNVDQNVKETVAAIAKRSAIKPKLGFVLGSGLAHFADSVEKRVEFPFAQLPHFATASVEGHPGKLIVGEIEGVPVAVLQGRLHAYEGHSMEQVLYPVRTLSALGVKTVVVTNAAGGLKKIMKPGDFMIIKDHINLSGQNPLRGPNWDKGPRFLDMTEPYDKKLNQILKACLRAQKARVFEGVYVGVMGPTYETAAEIQFYAKAGGGAVGMSTVTDVIAARHAGLRVAGLSCITNLGTGLSRMKLSHDDVKKVAQKVEKSFTKALIEFVKKVKSDL